MNVSEDELEQRLRALFADERLGVQPGTSAEETIVAGARRRRHRRHVVLSASGVTMAAVLVVGGFAVVKIRSSDSSTVMAATPPELSTQPPAPSTPGPPSAVSQGQTSNPQQPPPSSPPPGHAENPPHTTGGRGATTTPSKPQTSKVTTGPLLTANGIGALKLGMTEAQVTAQGMKVSNKKSADACSYFDVQGGGLPTSVNAALSQSSGVVAVTPAAPAHTPEGIGAGSSKEDVLTSYPGAAEGPDGLVAPAGQVANYHFTLTQAGEVASVYLSSVYQDC
ncbi:hypothetical protein ACFWY9_22375 [Amycolatopsis sp. NPDC059027]|uniref:hypothetical protein n=1 Tax=Amycolatopsis sp. NPDC059027 TaxID=3346709 RepID=UPI00366FC9D0